MRNNAGSPHDLTAAQSALDRAQYVQALHMSRALTEAADSAPAAEALRVRTLSAFRLGELDEAAATALRLVATAGRDAPRRSAIF